jgi:hypothetical protein
MKKKIKKLSLNKKTIANLTAAEMNGQVGGGKTIRGNSCIGHNTCFTCGKNCY